MRRTLITSRARAMRKVMTEAMLWSRLRVPASRICHDLTAVADGVLLRAEALIAQERRRMRLAPSTIGSSADGPLPAAKAGEVERAWVPLSRG